MFYIGSREDLCNWNKLHCTLYIPYWEVCLFTHHVIRNNNKSIIVVHLRNFLLYMYYVYAFLSMCWVSPFKDVILDLFSIVYFAKYEL